MNWIKFIESFPDMFQKHRKTMGSRDRKYQLKQYLHPETLYRKLKERISSVFQIIKLIPGNPELVFILNCA